MQGQLRKSASILGFLTAGLAILGAGACWAADQPGQHFDISPQDLPKPYATPAVDNSSKSSPRPADAMPQVPAGFSVSIYASGLPHPRWLAVAPNGDVFVTESDSGEVTVLHDSNGTGHGDKVSTFASGFNGPNGIAYHEGAIFVSDRTAVYRFAYRDGQMKGVHKTRVTKSSFGMPGGHFTRDFAFDTNGKMFLGIGSADNLGEDPAPRATVQEVSSDGVLSTYATGIRNAVGLAFYPGTDDLWVTVNERDGLGDDLPPDYLAHVSKDDFFGWPYAYTGPNPDPTFGTKRPDLVAKAKTPDVLFQAHSAPLGLVFYEGAQFPAEYKGDAFVSLHGSWNSSKPAGYKVVRVKFKDGKPVGGYDNFLTGFWNGSTSPAQVWGRPVGLAVAKDGSLLVADDAGKTIWRVAYTGK